MKAPSRKGLHTPPRVKVGVIVIDVGRYTHRWVTPLLDSTEIEVVCVSCIPPFRAMNAHPRGVRGPLSAGLAWMGYWGVRDTATFCCKDAWGRVGGRLGGVRVWRTVESVAMTRRMDLLPPPDGNINDEGFCADLRSREPDLLLCAFSQIAGEAFLAAPRQGCLNVHFSLLPVHRGREPIFHSMLQGYGGGVTVHWMTQRIDAGCVVHQEEIDVGSFRSLDAATLRAYTVAGRVVPRAVRMAIAWRGPRKVTGPLPRARGWPTRNQIAAFRARGFRFA